jgi:hypothetical protein
LKKFDRHAEVRFWHETDMSMQSPHVGCWGINGPWLGRGSKAENDPLLRSALQ